MDFRRVTSLSRWLMEQSRCGVWMDLAPDGCTMYYTSNGQHIQRYNICSSTQLPNLNNVPLSNRAYGGALGLRILPDGSVLAADHYNVQRLDSDGNVVGIYYGFP